MKQEAIRNVEQNGIVFLDEIDKIASRSETGGAEVSRAGVQRDLLPLVEGTTVNTKFGMIKTDHIPLYCFWRIPFGQAIGSHPRVARSLPDSRRIGILVDRGF